MKGEILKSLRLKANLTQNQLAEKLGIAASTIRMIEIGKRSGSDEVVNKIADFFDVSLGYLNGKREFIDDFITSLVNEGIITDPDNIDDETANMILNAVKAEVALKIKKHKKDEL